MNSSSQRLDRRIVIRHWSDVPNSAFGLTPVYDAGITRWARREPVHSLAIRAGVNTEEAPTDLFWVRYAPGTRPQDLTAEHVIELDGVRFRILESINVDDADQFTRITTKYLGAIA